MDAATIVDAAMEMAGDHKRVFAEGTVEEKRFFLRAFLKGIKLDPETSEGEATFVLLPGMQKLSPKPLFSQLSGPESKNEDPSSVDRSSRSYIALQGIEPWFGG